MVDLHMHTKNSDGSDTVRNLLKLCEEKELEIISITDHDTCKSYEDIKKFDYKTIYSGKIIVGCEITTSYKGRIVEILGYGVNPEIINEYMLNYYTPKHKLARKRYLASRLVKNLQRDGFDIELRDIDFSGFPEHQVYEYLVAHKEQAVQVYGEHIMESLKNFFRDGVVNPEHSLFIDLSKFSPSVDESIELIRKANGIAILAHPYQYAFDNTIDFLNEFIEKHKIDGVEVYHSTFTNAQMGEIEKWAREHNMMISGGSDYHGTVKPGIELGTGMNHNLNINRAIFYNWTKKRD